MDGFNDREGLEEEPAERPRRPPGPLSAEEKRNIRDNWRALDPIERAHWAYFFRLYLKADRYLIELREP